MSRVRLAIGVAIVVVLGTVLLYLLVRDMSGGAASGQTAAISEPPPVESPESSPTTSPEEVEPEEPIDVPTPDTTGRDFEKIFREINEFRNWLYRNPNPDLVHLIFHRECECHDDLVEQLQALHDDGLRFDDDGFIIEHIELLEDFPSLARVRVTMTLPPSRLVNAEGETVAQEDEESTVTVNVALVASASDRWLVRTVTRVG